MSITIKTNANRVSIKLRNLGKLNTLPLMVEIEGDLDDITASSFEKERDPVTGRPWKRLHPRTLESRKRRGKTGKKLQVTGRLRNSITTTSTRYTARIGTNVVYAGTHQSGNRTRSIPQRRFIGLSRLSKKKITRKAERFVKRAFNKT